MKPISVDTALLREQDHVVVHREGVDEDVRVLITRDVDDNPQYSVLLELSPEEKRHLIKNGQLWVTFFSRQIPKFSAFATEQTGC
jgi:hypothetical protein